MELSPRSYHCFVRPKWSLNLLNQNIFEIFDLRNSTVIDFGCGIGTISTMFAPENYIGVDIDASRINYARKSFPNHSFHVFDSLKLPAGDHTIEAILIMSVLHHIDSNTIISCLKEFYRVLKPHGRIIICEPYLKDHSRIRNWIMKSIDKGRYIRKEDEYLTLLNSGNFNSCIVKKYCQLFCYNKIIFTLTKLS